RRKKTRSGCPGAISTPFAFLLTYAGSRPSGTWSSGASMQPDKILIRGPNWVGDAVLSIPAMKSVRQRFPRARITLLVRPWVAGLFRAAPFVDTVWTRPRPGLVEWARTARRIRRRGFDLALIFPNSFESALTVFAGRVPRRIGYATDRRR